jgi:hypothetical protein
MRTGRRILRNILRFPARTARSATRRVSRVVLWLQGKRTAPWHRPSMKETFTNIFWCNEWRSQESVSGCGSTLSATETIRRELPALVARAGIRSILDIPCGDHHWLQHVALSVERYLGADIVPELVASTQAKFGNDHKTFVSLDLVRDPLPTVDLILCRDCLVHFSIADIFCALDHIVASRSKYLLTTDFPAAEHNPDIRTGHWRRLSLRQPPFCFPEPLQVIDENPPIDQPPGKTLSLWRVADIRGILDQRQAEGPVADRARPTA